MRERPQTTVRYRLLIEPSRGAGLGNTVHVGLDVSDADQLAPLVFEGLPRRVAQIREQLREVRADDHYLFNPDGYTTARQLRSVMRSPHMECFAPELVAAAAMFECETS